MTAETLLDMVMEKNIKYVKVLNLSIDFHHLDHCHLKPLVIKEISRGHWQSLVSLDIGNDKSPKIRSLKINFKLLSIYF